MGSRSAFVPAIGIPIRLPFVPQGSVSADFRTERAQNDNEYGAAHPTLSFVNSRSLDSVKRWHAIVSLRSG
jgi:hypothetical protein